MRKTYKKLVRDTMDLFKRERVRVYWTDLACHYKDINPMTIKSIFFKYKRELREKGIDVTGFEMGKRAVEVPNSLVAML